MALKGGKFSEKQRRFCEEWVVDMNHTQAAIRAGYSEKTAGSIGSELFKKPEIQLAIREIMEKINNDRIAKRDEVLERLSAMFRGEVSEEVVVVEGRGNGISMAGIIEKKISISDQIKAGQLLAKRYGIDKSDIENMVMAVQIVDDIE